MLRLSKLSLLFVNANVRIKTYVKSYVCSNSMYLTLANGKKSRKLKKNRNSITFSTYVPIYMPIFISQTMKLENNKKRQKNKQRKIRFTPINP